MFFLWQTYIMYEKQDESLLFDYSFTSVLYIITVLPHAVDWIVLEDGTLSYLDLLIQQ